MPGVSVVSKLTYLARETVAGTRVPPNLYIRSLNLRLLPVSTRGTVRPSGSLLSSGRPLIQESSTFSIEGGSYLDYNSCIYPLAGLLGLPVTTTPGGATLARQHVFTFDPSGANTRPTFTMVSGYRGGVAEEVTRATWQSFNFGFNRTGDPTIGGAGYGRSPDFAATLGVNEVNVVTITGTPTGGTFTITVNGQATAGIAFNAIASVVQTALEALSNVAPGDVTVTGGPGPGTPYTLTWLGTGAFANTDVTITSSGAGLTGGSTPAATTTTTQAGGVTNIDVSAVQAPEWDVFIDTTYAGIGTTKYDVYSGAFSFGGLTNPEWVVNSALTSFRGDILQVPTVTSNLVLSNDAAARSLYATLRTGAPAYVRFRAVGLTQIEASQFPTLTVDMACAGAENMAQFGDEGGAETLPIPLSIIATSTFTAGIQATVKNAVTSI